MERSDQQFSAKSCVLKYTYGRHEKTCSVQHAIDKIRSKYDPPCNDESKYENQPKYCQISDRRTYYSRQDSVLSSGGFSSSSSMGIRRSFYGFSMQVCKTSKRKLNRALTKNCC